MKKYPKYYIAKEKDFKCDLAYMIIDQNKNTYYVYQDGSKLKANLSRKMESNYTKRDLKNYWIEVPAPELALMI